MCIGLRLKGVIFICSQKRLIMKKLKLFLSLAILVFAMSATFAQQTKKSETDNKPPARISRKQAPKEKVVPKSKQSRKLKVENEAARKKNKAKIMGTSKKGKVLKNKQAKKNKIQLHEKETPAIDGATTARTKNKKGEVVHIKPHSRKGLETRNQTVTQKRKTRY